MLVIAALRGVQRLFAPLAGRSVVKATLGGVGIGAIALIAGEETLFSGEHELEVLLDHPEAYGASALLLILGGKVLALALSLETGFRGGRILPVLFIGSTVGFITSGWDRGWRERRSVAPRVARGQGRRQEPHCRRVACWEQGRSWLERYASP
jgi:H+/Cl- antiporter ClcA